MSGFSIVQTENKLFINGEEVKSYPPATFGMSVVQYDGKVFINGYRYDPKTKKFKFNIWSYIQYAL